MQLCGMELSKYHPHTLESLAHGAFMHSWVRVSYTDHWQYFCGSRGLIRNDEIHPAVNGAAVMSRNIARSFWSCRYEYPTGKLYSTQ